MRIHPIVLAVLAVACARGSPPDQPVPQPEASATLSWRAPPPLETDSFPVYVCVVRNGQLENVKVDLGAVNADTFHQGRTFRYAYPTDSTYALNHSWYQQSQPIAFARHLYVKYGLPRILAHTDVVSIGTYRGVTVFAEDIVNRERPEVFYIPVRPGCEFQPYVPLASK